MPEFDQIRLEVVTPYELFFDEKVEMVILTATDGEIGVLPGHTAMFAALKSGELRIKTDGQWRIAVTTNGYAEIAADMVIVVVNAAEWADEINVVRAQKSLERAEARFADPQISAIEKTHARHAIERAKARLKVAEQHGSKK